LVPATTTGYHKKENFNKRRDTNKSPDKVKGKGNVKCHKKKATTRDVVDEESPPPTPSHCRPLKKDSLLSLEVE